MDWLVLVRSQLEGEEGVIHGWVILIAIEWKDQTESKKDIVNFKLPLSLASAGGSQRPQIPSDSFLQKPDVAGGRGAQNNNKI